MKGQVYESFICLSYHAFTCVIMWNPKKKNWGGVGGGNAESHQEKIQVHIKDRRVILSLLNTVQNLKNGVSLSTPCHSNV